jgi:hypothetical protein
MTTQSALQHRLSYISSGTMPNSDTPHMAHTPAASLACAARAASWSRWLISAWAASAAYENIHFP